MRRYVACSGEGSRSGRWWPHERLFIASDGGLGMALDAESLQYRRVLVVVDGSSGAEAAVHKGAAIARRAGASLHVAGVLTPDCEMTKPLDRLDVRSMVTRGPSAAMAAYLKRLTDDIRSRWGCEVSGPLLVHGPPAETPAVLVAHVGADLLLSTAHRGGPMALDCVGDAVVTVARRAGIPVLVVPRTLAVTAIRPRVVVVMNRTADPAHRTLREARRFACLWGASVTTTEVAFRIPLAATGTHVPSHRIGSAYGDTPAEGRERATGRVLVVGDYDPGLVSCIRRIAVGPERRCGALLVCSTS